MPKVVIADDVVFDDDAALAAFRVQVVQRGQCAVEIIVPQAVLQAAVHSAMKAMEKRAGRECNIVAFPASLPHADTA